MIENNLLANDDEACNSRFHKVRLELQVQFEENDIAAEALAYTLRLDDVDRDLKDVPTRLSTHRSSEIDELLPHQWPSPDKV